MKKQIFILVFFALAIFATGTRSYGQYAADIVIAPTASIYCPTPTAVVASCVKSDELHPVPGTQYTYKVTVNDANSAIHWFVTKDPAFITGGVLTTNIEDKTSSDYVISAGTIVATSAAYNIPANTKNQIDVTWKSFDPTLKVFLVTYAKNSTGCTNNIQVYRIEPVQVFTLDIVALTSGGLVNITKSDCVSPVVSATYDATLNSNAGGIKSDYGQNYVFFAVNAANFAHSWKPSFKLTSDIIAANSPKTILTVDWSYSAAPKVWKATTKDGTDPTLFESATVVNAVNNIGASASGECIIVRVTVDHDTDETLADISLTLAVDGVMWDPKNSNYANLTKGDIHFDKGAASATPSEVCPWVDGFKNDKVVYALTHRPTVNTNTGTPILQFIKKN